MTGNKLAKGEPMQFTTFLRWEKASRESIDFKTVYVDMTGDLIAGLLLSQILYWNLPDDAGKTRLRVERDGKLWLVKSHDDWWSEIRISPKQAKRALALLEDLGLIAREYHRFNGLRMTHISIVVEAFMQSWNEAMEDPSEGRPVSTKGTPRSVRKGPTEGDERDRPLTETTTENTSENTATTSRAAAAAVSSPSITPIRQRVLEEMGIGKAVIPELLELPRDGPYLARWLEWVHHGDHARIKSVLGFAVAGIRVGDEPPAYREERE